MNHVVLMGRLTKDPELKYNANRQAYVRFVLAVPKDFPYNQYEHNTDFIDCVIFGTQAENLAKFITKGVRIMVEGYLNVVMYRTQKSVTVCCSKFEFADAKKVTQENETARQHLETVYFDEEIPF